ncbi:carbonic anhydrase [Oceanibaculum indicum]|nr:carbonic anhydrase family protein [Oceanibaculum indicum]
MMRRPTLSLALAALLTLTALPAGATPLVDQQHTMALGWDYKGQTGPAFWSSLSPSYWACGNGIRQSPIDVTAVTLADLPPLTLKYPGGALSVMNTGRVLKLRGGPRDVLDSGWSAYNLRHIDIRVPAEHRLDGREFAAELQLVHQRADGHVAILSVLMDEGRPNRGIDRVLAALPSGSGLERTLPDQSFSAHELLPDDLSYARYTGSLTVPPCTERVDWFVLRRPLTLSAEQARLLREAVGGTGNARPLQPRNGREIPATRN